MSKQSAVILGGGVGGLAAGWMLARTGLYDVTVVERAPVLGGLCGTFQHQDCLLDYGPHKCYSIIPGILDELRVLMGDEFLVHEKRNRLYLFESLLKYPISMAEVALKMGPVNLLRCGFDMVGTVTSGIFRSREPASYEQYIIQRFGRRLYDLIFQPLADKTWGDPATLSADIARTRLPSASLVDVVLRVLGLKSESEQTNAENFYYPRQGFGRITDRMGEEIVKAGGRILTDTSPVHIEHENNRISAVTIETDGRPGSLPVDLLVSSLPFDALVKLLGGASISHLGGALAAAEKLQYRGLILVYVTLDQDLATEDHWIFVPGKDLIFSRIFEQKQLSPEMIPDGKTVLCCDFTDTLEGEYWNQNDQELGARCVADLAKMGVIDPDRAEHTFVKRFPKFYPRYDLNYRETTSVLYNALKQYENLLPTGRVGFYNYNNSDHCVDMGRFIAESLSGGKTVSQIWDELEQRVSSYRIVD
jgi:protoporphyrinogen oxidase